MAKAKNHLSYTIRDFEKMYKKDMKGKDEMVIPTLTYRKLMKTFFKKLSLAIIRDNYQFMIPYKIGLVRITKVKTTLGSTGSIDWAKSQGKDKKVFHTNRHTNGLFFRWLWSKPWFYTQFKNSAFYKFTPVRGTDGETGKLGLSKWVMKCAKDPMLKDYDVLK